MVNRHAHPDRLMLSHFFRKAGMQGSTAISRHTRRWDFERPTLSMLELIITVGLEVPVTIEWFMAEDSVFWRYE